jgi:hypothetical protein
VKTQWEVAVYKPRREALPETNSAQLDLGLLAFKKHEKVGFCCLVCGILLWQPEQTNSSSLHTCFLSHTHTFYSNFLPFLKPTMQAVPFCSLCLTCCSFHLLSRLLIILRDLLMPLWLTWEVAYTVPCISILMSLPFRTSWVYLFTSIWLKPVSSSIHLPIHPSIHPSVRPSTYPSNKKLFYYFDCFWKLTGLVYIIVYIHFTYCLLTHLF